LTPLFRILNNNKQKHNKNILNQFKMGSVYIIEEASDIGREIYPAAYTSYDKALAVVKAKFKDWLERATTEEEEGVADPPHFNAPENPSGTTDLYIEYGKTNIYIRKLPIVSEGGKRKNKRASRKMKRKLR